MYKLLGFQSATDVDNGCDAERSADTFKEAKWEALYMLSDAYKRACEASAPLEAVHIYKDGELIVEIY
jgi:hypothetical protein